MSKSYKARPARLDADRTAQPLTRLKARVRKSPSGRIMPHDVESYRLEDCDDTGGDQGSNATG